MANNNVWRAFLEETPDVLYRAMTPQKGSQSFLDYWNANFNKVYNNYLGELGRGALYGSGPDLSFYNYLSNLNWQGDWGRLTPSQRGLTKPLSTYWNIPY